MLNAPGTDDSPIDAYIIGINWTQYFNIAEKDKPFIKEIRGIYIFDNNLHTHLCEFTPSFTLEYLYTTIVWNEEAPGLEDVQDQLQAAYCYEEMESVTYYHVSDVEVMMEREPAWVHHYGKTEVSFNDSTREEQMEGLREHFCGNCVL